MSTRRQKEEARKRKLERRGKGNEKESIQISETIVEDAEIENEKIPVKDPGSNKDFDRGKLLEQAGNNNPQTEKFGLDQLARNLPQKENPGKEGAITYYATNGGLSLNLIFFVGKDFNTSLKKGKAILNPTTRTLDLYVLSEWAQFEKTKAGNHKKIAQIYFSDQKNGVWKATTATYKLQSAKELTFNNSRYRDTVIKDEQEICSGEINFVLQKSLEEVKKRMILALQS